MGNLLPSHTRHWWPIVEDVFACKAIHALLASMELTLRSGSEFLCISINATLKVAMSIKGQASYRSSRSIRNQACFGDDEALRRVLTVRGRTGAVLAMQLIKGEEAPEVALALQRSLSEVARAQVLYVMSDSPSVKLLQALTKVFPNLRGMALDPVHLAIVYEYAQWQTSARQALRFWDRCFTRWFQHDSEKGMLSWGSLYDGRECDPLSRQEEAWRKQILSWTHTQAYAQRVINNLDPNVPVYTRVSFIEALAAICALHTKEVDRKVTGMNKPVRQLLWTACSPSRLEWLFNNQRSRHSLAPHERCLLPSGTTSNEALHSQINSWSRSTHEVHRSTLKLKLQVYTLGKQLSHHLALCFPPVRQTAENVSACTLAGWKPLDRRALEKFLLYSRWSCAGSCNLALLVAILALCLACRIFGCRFSSLTVTNF